MSKILDLQGLDLPKDVITNSGRYIDIVYKDFSEYKRVLNQSRILIGSFMFVLTFSIFVIIKILRTFNKGK